jgi:hypothetical protein
MLARFLPTNDCITREHGERPEVIDSADELASDCLCQSSNKHWGRHDLQGHWVDAKDARAGRDQ